MRSYFSKKYIYTLSGSLLVILGLFLFFLLPHSSIAQNTTAVVSILNLVENQILSQNYTFNFESTNNPNFVELNFVRLENNNLPDKRAVAVRADITTNIWSYTLDLSLLGNGLYRLETVGILADGTEIAGQTRKFYINQTPTILNHLSIITPSNQAVLAGNVVFQAEASQPVSEVIFSIFNSLGIFQKQIVSSMSVAQTTHTTYFNSSVLGSDGTYKLKAQTTIGDNIIDTETITFYLANNYNQNSTSTSPQNTTTTPPINTTSTPPVNPTSTIVNLTFTSPVDGKEIAGQYLLQVRTNVEVDQLFFRFDSNLVVPKKYDKYLWQAYILTTNYPNGQHLLVAFTSSQGHEYNSPLIRVQVKNAIATIPTTDTAPPLVKTNPIIPPIINKISENNPVNNNLLPNDKLLLPPLQDISRVTATNSELVDCQNENLKNITCQVYLRNRDNFSNECVTKVLNIDDCLNTYDKCKSSGVLNIDACFKYTTEPRASRWCDLEEFKNEPLCTEYNSQRLVPQTTSNLDMRCLDQGIASQVTCDRYLEFINLPQECKAQKIITKKECIKFLESNYTSTACQIIGLTDKTACQQQILENYQNQKTCTGVDCQAMLKDFMPELAARDVSKQVLAQARLKLTNNFINLESQNDSEVKPLVSRLPVKFAADGNYKIFNTDDVVDITNGQISSPLPMALVKDSDQDGLPNDMEYRLGTMVDNPDTDGDGYLDGEEVRNGYDPLLPATKLATKLAPVEVALINNATFEHPLSAGSETSDLQISEVINSSDEENNNLIINGIGTAFSVVTLYIYSDIPLIATAQVDEYGRWQYAITDNIVDGQHEVYVVINDDTGKVEKKSLGKIFFVNQAQAATVNDYINLSITQEPKVLEKYYLYGAIGLVLLAIILFLLLYFRGRGKQNIFPS